MRQKSFAGGDKSNDSLLDSLLLYWKLMKSKPLLILQISLFIATNEAFNVKPNYNFIACRSEIGCTSWETTE